MVDILIWILFGSVIIVALPLQLLGLPGTWLLAGDALVLRLLKGPDLMDYQTVFILVLMAAAGEVLEFVTAVQGARTGPPVKGATVAAIVGAIAGGIAGAPILFGLGALPGMAIGAWAAVFIVAVAGGASFGSAFASALGAMTGRIKGTVLKLIIAVGMVAVIIVSLVF